MAQEPAEKPVKQPLRHRTPPGTVRELPNGRGFLRALPGGGGGPSPEPSPAPGAPAPGAPAPGAPAPALVFDANGQADLFSWRPAKRGEQLSLFPGDP